MYNERVHLLSLDRPATEQLEHDEVVPTHLGEKTKSRNRRITRIRPNMDLPKHASVNGAKCFIGNSQAKRFRGLELDFHH